MKIAILISGHCRTFVFQEQYIFFENFMKYLRQFGQCDVYVMLKTDDLMKTEQGIINLEKIIKMLNPVYSIAFKQWNYHDNNCYYSQMRMIRHLVDKAISLKAYDYYVRIRPDLFIPDIKEIKLSNMTTSRKFDSFGNDQFFIMSHQVLKNWFLKLPITPMDVSPEYIIFNNIKLQQTIKSGLVRGYKRIEGWNSYHCHLRTKWLPEQQFVKFTNTNDIYINKLKKILDYKEVI
jgi:hypothetical protein